MSSWRNYAQIWRRRSPGSGGLKRIKATLRWYRRNLGIQVGSHRRPRLVTPPGRFPRQIIGRGKLVVTDSGIPVRLFRNIIKVAVAQEGSLYVGITDWSAISNAGIAQLVNGDLRILPHSPEKLVGIGFSGRAKHIADEVHVGVLLLRAKRIISVNVSLLPATGEVPKVGIMTGRPVEPIGVDLIK